MRHALLLIVTAVVEAGAGACLLFLPAAAFELLLGVGRAAPEAALVGRVAGAALLALGVASWSGRSAGRGPAAVGLLRGLLVYNVSGAAILAYAGLGLGASGPVLWPAVVLHAALAGWCVACLRITP